MSDQPVPFCFEPEDDFLYESLSEACAGCTIAYQWMMLGQRRCLPPDALVTPIGRIQDRLRKWGMDDGPAEISATVASSLFHDSRVLLG